MLTSENVAHPYHTHKTTETYQIQQRHRSAVGGVPASEIWGDGSGY